MPLSATAVREILAGEGFAPLPRRLDAERPALVGPTTEAVVGYPVADTIGGLTAAYAIAAALVRRERGGEGEFIDVSMLEATLVTMGWQVSNWLIAGVRPRPLGNENMTAAPSGTFATGDGPLNIAANRQEQFETLVRLIGRAGL